MKKVSLYGRAELLDMEMEYYIISEDISEKYSDLQSYGIKIVKTKCNEVGGKVSESKEIDNIFYRRDDVEKFADILIRNTVTPMSLMDVVEDYIVDYFVTR